MPPTTQAKAATSTKTKKAKLRPLIEVRNELEDNTKPLIEIVEYKRIFEYNEAGKVIRKRFVRDGQSWKYVDTISIDQPSLVVEVAAQMNIPITFQGPLEH